MGTAEPIPVSAFVEHALYAEGTGFYERGGRAGRRGDFVTSPEVGPLFGAVLARALDGWWDEQRRPDPFVIHEHGAGPGTLARAVVQARPACGPALRWVLVERSATQRQLHPDHLPHVGAPGSGAWSATRAGPLVATTGARPAGLVHVLLANELLDNLPFDLAQRTRDGWDEICLVAVGDGTWAEVARPLDADRSARLDRLAPAAAVGARVPLQSAAGEWVAAGRAQLEAAGRLVVFDYTATTAELADRPWAEWVRTYRGHERGGTPWIHPGTQDVTVEVALDQVGVVAGPPDRVATQAETLRRWGIDALVEEGREMWRARTGPADLAALRARSRVGEAEALLETGGLGGFTVAEWRGGP
ncbi:MAG TPA: SAM-dependent methyltransferase [Iamia sp.]|nr:SAM-dependent methyltransferase [Iamia sp.]